MPDFKENTKSMFALLALLLPLFAQNPVNCLCQKQERMVYTFQTQRHKIVSVCSGANDAYLVYRFGTKARIELQYPAQLDKSSWQQFELYSYYRGGGVQNAGMEENHLSFTNNNIRYTLFDDFSAETNRQAIGISIKLPNNKALEIKGLPKTKQGDLQALDGKVPKADF